MTKSKPEVLRMLRRCIEGHRKHIGGCEQMMRDGLEPVDFEFLRIQLHAMVKAEQWILARDDVAEWLENE